MAPQGWGCTTSWEGTWPGQLTPADQRDIPYHMMLCSVIKTVGKKEEGAKFRVTVFVFPSNCYKQRSPAFLEMAEHLPVNGK